MNEMSAGSRVVPTELTMLLRRLRGYIAELRQDGGITDDEGDLTNDIERAIDALLSASPPAQEAEPVGIVECGESAIALRQRIVELERKERVVAAIIERNGDGSLDAMNQIDRDDALLQRDHWMQRAAALQAELDAALAKGGTQG